jgi:hypothetical protein
LKAVSHLIEQRVLFPNFIADINGQSLLKMYVKKRGRKNVRKNPWLQCASVFVQVVVTKVHTIHFPIVDNNDRVP